jgi:hypothetical protein
VNLDGNIDVLAQPVEDVHQPVDGETLQLHLPDTRKVRRGDRGQLLRLADDELAVVEHAYETRRAKE